jgi:hypothetical protein
MTDSLSLLFIVTFLVKGPVGIRCRRIVRLAARTAPNSLPDQPVQRTRPGGLGNQTGPGATRLINTT